MRVVRLNCNSFPMENLEKKILAELGMDEIIEIEGTTQEEIGAAAAEADVVCIIAAKVRKQSIEMMKKCKLLCRYGTGTDNIDVDFATGKGILVTNVPDFCINEMADHAMAMLLGLVRRTLEMHHAVVSGDWLAARTFKKMHRLTGKTLGLIGFGNVGKALAVRAAAFGLKVIDYHRNVKPEEERQYGVRPVSLETIYTESDFIVVLCPLTRETEGMIGEKEIDLMKKDAIIVNIARGAIINETALAKALKEKRIAGAGIDVFGHLNMFKQPEGRPMSPYFELDNIMLSPHIAGTSVEAWREDWTKALKEVERVLLGVWPKNCVNPDVRPWFAIEKPVK